MCSANKRLVKNEQKYWPFIRKLRNDKRVKEGFVSQQHISEEDHEDFMKDHGDKYYICLVGDVPAGFAGSIMGDIRVATDPCYQGKGVGKFMISEILLKFPDSYAKVKTENKASLALFESCGFKKKYFILERE